MNQTFTEVRRITLNVTAFCALGGIVLGGVFVATDRYQELARREAEQSAIAELLHVDPTTAEVLSISQYLSGEDDAVVYRVAAAEAEVASVEELRFSLDGELLGKSTRSEPADDDWKSLGRIFVVLEEGAPSGFVVEGETRGYKNRIVFFLGIDAEFHIAGVRVLEHEEDPGLGAEVATTWFGGQFLGRSASGIQAVDVTKDPMPEDWSRALRQLEHLSPEAWAERYGEVAGRERANDVYAITGATISSRAMTEGIQQTLSHFQYRWNLLATHLEASP